MLANEDATVAEPENGKRETVLDGRNRHTNAGPVSFSALCGNDSSIFATRFIQARIRVVFERIREANARQNANATIGPN